MAYSYNLGKAILLSALFLFTAIVSFAQPPVAYYPMNGNANDASGNALNGTINGSVTPTTDRFGNPTGAMSFAGNSSSYIQVADNPLLRPASISISVWVNIAVQTSLASFVDKAIGSCINDSWHFGTDNGLFSAWVSNSFSCGDFAQLTSPISLNTWKHVVFTIDDVANTRKLYVDGVLVASGAYNASIPYDASPVLIGAAIENGGIGSFPLNGSLDDIRIYDRAISQAEVTNLFSPQQTLYVVSGAGNSVSTLYKIDPATGALISTVGSTGYSHITGLAVHPATGVIYAHANNYWNNGTSLLLVLDPVTGAGTVIGNTAIQSPDMSFSPSGVLYAWAENGDALYTINTNTGAATLVGTCNNCPSTFQTGLAVSQTGQIFMKSGSELYQVNSVTGQISAGPVFLSGPVHNILAFDANNVMYSGQRSGSNFILKTIDPGTGAVTTMGSSAISNISAIAFSVPALPCSGAPGAGTASGPSNVCSGSTFTVSTTGYTFFTGMGFQWQSSPSGINTWTNIAGATSPFYSVSNQTSATDYRIITTCSNSGLSDTSNEIAIGMSTFLYCYCSPLNGTQLHHEAYNQINNVEIPTTSLNSANGLGVNGYQQVNPLMAGNTATLNIGYTYTLNVSLQSATAASAWIDYNQNGIFEASEYIPLSYWYNSTGSFSVPPSALTGQTGMRIRGSYYYQYPDTDPCALYFSEYGETEDYIITIAPQPLCAGTPVAGTAASSDYTVCAGNGFTLSLDGYTQDAGIGFQWQSSPVGANAWSDIGGVTTTSYNLASGQAVSTDYRVIVTCPNSGLYDSSNVVTVNTADINPGNTVASVSSACADQFFDLGVQNPPTGLGITYQWFSSSDGTNYSLIPDATDALFNTSQTAATYYQLEIYCGGNTTTSNALLVGMAPFYNCYCSPLNGTQLHYYWWDQINNVEIPTTTLNSSNGIGSEAHLQVDPGIAGNTATLTIGYPYTMNVATYGNITPPAAWIDYDHNGSFEPNEYIVFSNGPFATGNFNVPVSALPGQTGMRVRASYYNPYLDEDPCTLYSFEFGETEDYVITLIAQPTCSGAPVAGTASGPDFVCGNTGFLLSTTGYTPDAGISFQWQSSPAGTNTWNDISGATTPNYNVAGGQLAATDYRVIVTCSTSSLADTSNEVAVGNHVVTPGNTLSSTINACSNIATPFTLSLQNPGFGLGVTYQWFSSPDGISYSPVVGATDSTLITTQADTTYYKAEVYCGGGMVTSTPVMVGMEICYCIANVSAGCTDEDVVARVILNTLDNNSGTGCPSGLLGYSDYTDSAYTTTLQPATAYTCTVYVGRWNENFAAWIDYNDDGSFDLSERIGYTLTTVQGSGTYGVLGQAASFPVILSCTPPSGVHRLRVRCVYGLSDGSSITPCGSASYGETEDYLITIVAPPACASGGFLDTSNITQTSADLSWSMGCATAAHWDFEYGPPGFTQGTGTLLSNVAADSSYQLTGLTPNTAYQVYYRANCGDSASTWSFAPNFTTLPPPCTAPSLSLAGTNLICFGDNSGAINLTTTGGTAPFTYLWVGPFGSFSVQEDVSNLPAGFYTVTVTATGGCSAEDTITITQPADFPVTANSNSPICENGTLNLFSNSGPDYSWTGPNGFLSNVQSPSITGATPAATGTYQVTITVGGCSKSANTFVVVNANLTYYQDADVDGYGNAAVPQVSCTGTPPGYVSNSLDCNDADNAIHPGAAEVCDGIDNNCNSSIDEGLMVTYYLDNDLDGYGNPLLTQTSCNGAPAGYVANNQDCNDADTTEHPGQTWYIDNDADGYGGSTVVQCLRPTNGHIASELIAATGDCNDNNAAIHPGATEICNNIDDNCNGSVDEGLSFTTYYADFDGDTYGNPAAPLNSCSGVPANHVLDNTDCNDVSAIEHPGQTWWTDADGDHYGTGVSVVQCARPANGYAASELTATSGDCNDANAAIHPGAAEICDGVDNNCNGSTDEGLMVTYYQDSDGDGYGNPAVSTTVCSGSPANYVTNSQDCDDTDPLQKPGQVWFTDNDGDGYGTGASVTQCLRPLHGYLASELTSTTGDCNDNNPNINPVAQTLSFSGAGAFTSSLINTTLGSQYTLFQFEVIYTDINNNLPPAFYPRVILDYEGNGVFNNANDRTIVMSEADASDVTTVDGKKYIASINNLVTGTNYQTRIQISNSGCITQIGPFNYPDVLVQPDLEIFANDITFSTPNPAVSSPLTVNAVVHNQSDYVANNFVVHLVNQFDTTQVYGDILVPSLAAHGTTTVSWNITTPAVPAWCPMAVTIDYTNVITETNELNNSAIRPFTNGNFNIPGGIHAYGHTSPSVASVGTYSIGLYGSAYYYDTAVPLADSSVAGATVTYTIVETGATYSTYTNSAGQFSTSFPVWTYPAGTYHITGSVTDFTLTGNFSTEFTLIAVPVCTNPDLVSGINITSAGIPGQGSNVIVAGSTLTGTYTVTNLGVTTSAATTMLVTLTGAAPVSISVPPLAQNASFSTNFSIPFNTPGTYTLCTNADPNNNINECYEYNNGYCVNIYVLPALPDIIPYYGPCCSAFICNIGNPGFTLYNAGGVGTGLFTTAVLVRRNGVLEATLNANIPNMPALTYYSFSVPYSYPNGPGAYTYEVQADIPHPNGIVVEVSEANNTGNYATLVEACKPNLSFMGCENFDVQPVDPAFPGAVTLLATIYNSGNATAIAPIAVDFSLSGGAVYSTTYNSNLAPGQSAVVTVNAASVPPATQTLTAIVDPANTIDEFSEADNSISNSMCWDFIATPTCGTNFWDHGYVLNQTLTPYIGVVQPYLYDASSVKVRFSVSGPGIPGTVVLGDGILNNVEQNCYCPYVAVCPNNIVFNQVGTYTFTMTVDPDNDYTECSESNNTIVRSVTVTNLPDMRILSQHIAPNKLNPQPNEPITFNISYQNIGLGNIGQPMKLKLKMDNDFIDSTMVTGLVTNGLNTVAMNVAWSSNLVGIHVIRAIIDADNQVIEGDEMNNEATRAVIVGEASNLHFASFGPSNGNPADGDTVTVSAVIGNNGDLDNEGDVKLYYANLVGDTIFIGNMGHVNVPGNDTIPAIHFTWYVQNVSNIVALVAKIENSVTLEFTYDDNMATAAIGGPPEITLNSTSGCDGSNGLLSAIVFSGRQPYSYSWSNGAFTTSITAVPGTYTVIVTDANGASDTATGTINNATSSAYYHDADGDGYGDPNDSLMLCSLPVILAIPYVPNNLDCNDNDSAIHPGATEICGNSIDDNCDGQVDEGCGIVCPPCTKAPKKPAITVSGASLSSGTANKFCAGDTITVSVNVPDANACTYNWTAPTGGNIISGQGTSAVTIVLNNNFTANSTVSVYAQNLCGQTAPASKPVNAGKNIYKPGAIAQSGIAKICPGETRVFSVPSIPGISVYTWTAPAGTNVLSGQGTTDLTLEFTSGFTATGPVQVVTENACGTSAITKKNATFGTKPPVPSAITGDKIGVCGAVNVPYSVIDLGYAYNWFFDTSQATISSGQGTANITADFTTAFTIGALNVTAANGCGISSPRKLNGIKSIPAAPAVPVGPNSACFNQMNVAYFIPAVQGAATYTWTAPVQATISDGVTTSTSNVLTTSNNAVTINFGIKKGNVKVMAHNDCGNSGAKSLAVNVTNCGGPRAIEDMQYVQVFPNPVHDQLNVLFYAHNETKYSIKVFDALGKEVLQRTGNATEGSNQTLLQVSNLAAGVYQMFIVGEGMNYKARFVVE